MTPRSAAYATRCAGACPSRSIGRRAARAARVCGPSAASTSRSTAIARSQRASSSPSASRRGRPFAAKIGPSRPMSQPASCAATRCSVPRIAHVQTSARSRNAASTSAAVTPVVRGRNASRANARSCAWTPTSRAATASTLVAGAPVRPCERSRSCAPASARRRPSHLRPARRASVRARRRSRAPPPRLRVRRGRCAPPTRARRRRPRRRRSRRRSRSCRRRPRAAGSYRPTTCARRPSSSPRP